MNIESFRTYCLNKKGVTEEFPFDEETLVLKVMGKMFALTGINHFTSINIKCDPERAVELRERASQLVQEGEANYTTGLYSIFAKIVCRDTNHLKLILHDKIQKIAGIQRTETFISLDQSISRAVAF